MFRPVAPLATALVATLTTLSLSSCSPCAAPNACAPDACTAVQQSLAVTPISALPSPADGEFSVMSFNLHQFLHFNRDDNPETLEPKPPREIEACIAAIRTASPDILVVQEMGTAADFDSFKEALRTAGLNDYHYEEFLPHDANNRNLALLSRLPILSRHPHTDDRYTIGPTQFPVRRGFLDVEIAATSNYTLRVMAAHLKSKLFHDYGQAEMRRNEARLLCNHVRAAIRQNPDVNLLVCGDLNDTPSSASIRELSVYQDQRLLFDLRPLDPLGDAWTYRGADDSCERIDYFFANANLTPEYLPSKSGILNHPDLAAASDHRPLLAVFSATDIAPRSVPPFPVPPTNVFPMDE